MAVPRSASLHRRFPKRIDIPLLLVASAGLLAFGLIIPAVETRAIFWRNEYSILVNMKQMTEQGRHLAAAIIAVCSIIYPAVKLGLLLFFWLFPFPARWRWKSIQAIRLIGRWSMVDVFTIVAILLSSMAIGPLEASPRAGLFLYAAGMLTLMLAALLMDRLARCRR